MRQPLTGYGPIFEVWLDGANGGNRGYYKGKVGAVESRDVNEGRTIDRSRYYGWPATWDLHPRVAARRHLLGHRPGPAAWCGNEGGTIAPTPCGRTYTPHPTTDPKNPPPGIGSTKYWEGEHGRIATASSGFPPRSMSSIRPGWFWHASQNRSVRPPAKPHADLSSNSVGHGATMNLNCPPDPPRPAPRKRRRVA